MLVMVVGGGNTTFGGSGVGSITAGSGKSYNFYNFSKEQKSNRHNRQRRFFMV